MISVITATIPERAQMLEECIRSVQAQTFKQWQHITMLDSARAGCSVMVNKAVAESTGDWIFPLADDDLILPRCLQAHYDCAVETGADIVYGPPLVWGLHDPWWFFQEPPAIPSTALVRASLWHELDGYDETAAREEDRKMWVKALEAGARFERISDQPTWIYRIHDANKSMAERRALAAA